MFLHEKLLVGAFVLIAVSSAIVKLNDWGVWRKAARVMRRAIQHLSEQRGLAFTEVLVIILSAVLLSMITDLYFSEVWGWLYDGLRYAVAAAVLALFAAVALFGIGLDVTRRF